MRFGETNSFREYEYKYLRHKAVVDDLASSVVGTATVGFFQHCVDKLISDHMTTC